MNKNTNIVIFFLAILIIFGLIIFLNPKRPLKNPISKPTVAATFFPIYDITRNIAGANIEVINILPPGASPHTFEPTPKIIGDVVKAKAIYAIGYGIDDWVDTIKAKATPKIQLDKNIQLRRGETDENDLGIDPHYWLTIPNAKIMAQNIAADLETRFPEYQTEFQANLRNYLTNLDTAETKIKGYLSGLKNNKIITLHDAWYYFGDAYNMNIVGTFEPSAGKEPTPQYLSALKSALIANKINVLYSEPSVSVSTLASFVQDNKLKIVILDPVEGVEAESSYINVMTNNALLISENQP